MVTSGTYISLSDNSWLLLYYYNICSSLNKHIIQCTNDTVILVVWFDLEVLVDRNMEVVHLLRQEDSIRYNLYVHYLYIQNQEDNLAGLDIAEVGILAEQGSPVEVGILVEEGSPVEVGILAEEGSPVQVDILAEVDNPVEVGILGEGIPVKYADFN